MRPTKTQISLGIHPVWSGFTVRMKKHWVLGYPLSTQGRMIRLGWCPGWFESSLGAFVILLVLSYSRSIIEPQHDKTNKMSVRPGKTQISLGIRPDWSVFAVRMKKAWVLSYPLSAVPRLWSDWQMPRLIWVFDGRTLILFVLSCRVIFRTVTGSIWLQDRTAP